MMEKKKQNTIIFGIVLGVVCLIVLIVLIATGTINFGKIDDDVSEHTNNGQEKISWYDYLLSQEITNITITRKRSKEYNDSYNMEKTININIENLKSIIDDIKNLELEKTYALSLGSMDKDHLTVSYTVDNISYTFEIYHGSIFVDKADKGLIEILENDDYPVFNENIRNTAGVYEFYHIIEFSNDFYDVYFN